MKEGLMTSEQVIVERQCERCGANISHTRQKRWCKPCWLPVRRERDARWRPRRCGECGKNIAHRDHRAQYCESCAKKRAAEQVRLYHRQTFKRRLAGPRDDDDNLKPLGVKSPIPGLCAACGVRTRGDYTIYWRARRCIVPACYRCAKRIINLQVLKRIV